MTRALALSLLSALLSTSAYATPMRERGGGYELQVLTEGRPTRSYWHGGENWVLGRLGERYTLRVLNHTSRTIEAVVSVDGRDITDGGPGDAGKRGYLVPAYGSIDLDGWRISHSQAAAFRFSSVADSYAAQTGSGREVGVIGVAVFEERPPVVLQPVPPPQYWGDDQTAEPADKGYAQGRASAQPPAAPPPVATAVPEAAGKAAGPRNAASPTARRQRSGLGTEYGEAVTSYISDTTFDRASSSPAIVLGCRYNDRTGLIALGINVDGVSEMVVRETAEPFPTVERGFAQPPPGWRP